MRSEEVLPGCVLAAFRRWRNAVASQNVSDGLPGDVVTEIGQGTGDPIVAPTGVLLGHTDDQRLGHRINARASWMGTMLRAVELAGDQTTIPGQNGVWLGNAGNLRELFSAKALRDLGERGSLGIGEPQSPGNVRAEDPILGD